MRWRAEIGDGDEGMLGFDSRLQSQRHFILESGEWRVESGENLPKEKYLHVSTFDDVSKLF